MSSFFKFMGYTSLFFYLLSHLYGVPSDLAFTGILFIICGGVLGIEECMRETLKGGAE